MDASLSNHNGCYLKRLRRFDNAVPTNAIVEFKVAEQVEPFREPLSRVALARIRPRS